MSESGENGPLRIKRRSRKPRSRRRHRRRIPPLSVMPTLVTLGNLVAGFAAIHYAAKPIGTEGLWGWSSLTLAGALVFLGMFFDSVDGSVARLTRTHSDLGAQLDSLADLVTFGVAPAYMMLRLVSTHISAEGAVTILGPDVENAWVRIVWSIAAVYLCCTALRLARFNVETPSAAVEDHLLFRGLPSPGAAGTVASLIVLHQHWLVNIDLVENETTSLALARWTAFGVPIVTFLCALAMISSIPYVHFMNRYVRGKRSFPYVVRIVVPVVLMIWWFQEVLAVAFTLYAAWSPVRLLVLQVRKRRRAAT